MKERFTACLIVKNEEQNIERCLDSLQNFVSQIVIVDTGSTDNTIQIISNYNVDLYFHKWNNDFSEARNNSLKYALNEWILVIDADEVISNFQIDKKILDSKEIGGLTCKITNYIDKELTQQSVHNYTRVFRNNSNIRFSGKIHEQVKESIEDLGLKIVESNIDIHHFGYINTSSDKKERNLELLKQSDLSDDFNKMNLADTLFSLDNLEEAKKNYLSITESLNLTENQKDKVKIRLGQISLKQNQYKDVLEYTEFESNDIDLEGLRLFVRAAAFLSLNDFKNAKEIYSSEILLNSTLIDKNVVKKALLVLENI